MIRKILLALLFLVCIWIGNICAISDISYTIDELDHSLGMDELESVDWIGVIIIAKMATDVYLDTSNFDKNLSTANVNVQSALETLDELVGGGDMTKAIYDTGANDIVDNSEALSGYTYDAFVSTTGDTMSGDLILDKTLDVALFSYWINRNDNLVLFNGNDVGDDTDGYSFYIDRCAVEGDSTLQMYIDKDKVFRWTGQSSSLIGAQTYHTDSGKGWGITIQAGTGGMTSRNDGGDVLVKGGNAGGSGAGSKVGGNVELSGGSGIGGGADGSITITGDVDASSYNISCTTITFSDSTIINSSSTFQGHDTDLDDLADGTLSKSKVEDSGNWDSAYGWGDHSTQGYLTDLATGTITQPYNANTDIDNTDDIVDGDFTSAGLMKTDGAGNYSIIFDSSTNWNTAHGWGDHAIQGYKVYADSISYSADSDKLDSHDWSEISSVIVDTATYSATSSTSTYAESVNYDVLVSSADYAPGDNLGDHTATQDIDASGYKITSSSLAVTNNATVGDLIVDTNTLVVDAVNNRVGIGTASPNASLEVKGAKPAGNVGGFQSGMFHVTGVETAEFSNSVITGHSAYNTNTQLWYLGSLSSSNDNIGFLNRQNGGIYFYTNNAFKMIIDATGNVGIGTDAPGSKLEVNGTIHSDYGISATTGVFSGQVTSNSRKVTDTIEIDAFYIIASTTTAGTTPVRISAYRDYAITITTMTVKGFGTTTCVGMVEQRAKGSDNSAGTDIWSGDITISTTTYSGGTISDYTVPANSALWFVPTSWAGDVDQISFDGKGTKD